MIRYSEEVRTQTVANFNRIGLPFLFPIYILSNLYDWLAAPSLAPLFLTVRGSILPLLGLFYLAFKKRWPGPWHLIAVWSLSFVISAQHAYMAFEAVNPQTYLIGLSVMAGAFMIIFPLPFSMTGISVGAAYVPMLYFLLSPGQNQHPFSPLTFQCLGMMVLFTVTSVSLERFRFVTFRQRTNLFLLATTDSLSGLKLRRYFFNRFIQELSLQLRRNDGPFLTVAMIDIDSFKLINDRFGHADGDRCIRHVGELIQNSIRIYDVGCRFGGEEFAIFFPSSQLSESGMVCERIRKVVESSPLTVNGKSIPLSISVGLSGIAPPIPSKIRGIYFSNQQEQKMFLVKCMMRIMKEADSALYEAKKKGKNRVVIGQTADLESDFGAEENAILKQYLVYFEQQALMLDMGSETSAKKQGEDVSFYPPEFFFRRCIEGMYRSYRDPQWSETLTLIRITKASDERGVKKQLASLFRLADVFSLLEPGLVGILFVGMPESVIPQLYERIKTRVQSMPGMDHAEIKIAAALLQIEAGPDKHRSPNQFDYSRAVDKIYTHLRSHRFQQGEDIYYYHSPLPQIHSRFARPS